MLTDKQEKYVQLVASGLSQHKAYRQAYPSAKKWKDSTVDSRASNLLKNSKVFARYEELRAENKRLSAWTREASLDARKDRHKMAHEKRVQEER